MTLTQGQYQVLSHPGRTSRLAVVRRLSKLGLVTITGEYTLVFSHKVIMLAFDVTERGNEELELARACGLEKTPRGLSRNREAYKLRQKGKTWVEIGRQLGIDPSSARGLVKTFKKHLAESV